MILTHFFMVGSDCGLEFEETDGAHTQDIQDRFVALNGNLLLNGGSFLGVLSKAFCTLQSHLKFLQLFSGGGGSL